MTCSISLSRRRPARQARDIPAVCRLSNINPGDPFSDGADDFVIDRANLSSDLIDREFLAKEDYLVSLGMGSRHPSQNFSLPDFLIDMMCN